MIHQLCCNTAFAGGHGVHFVRAIIGMSDDEDESDGPDEESPKAAKKNFSGEVLQDSPGLAEKSHYNLCLTQGTDIET